MKLNNGGLNGPPPLAGWLASELYSSDEDTLEVHQEQLGGPSTPGRRGPSRFHAGGIPANGMDWLLDLASVGYRLLVWLEGESFWS